MCAESEFGAKEEENLATRERDIRQHKTLSFDRRTRKYNVASLNRKDASQTSVIARVVPSLGNESKSHKTISLLGKLSTNRGCANRVNVAITTLFAVTLVTKIPSCLCS